MPKTHLFTYRLMADGQVCGHFLVFLPLTYLCSRASTFDWTW